MSTPEDQLTQRMTLPEFADAVGDRLGLPKVLRDAIFERESNFQHYDASGRVKRSSAGALGVGQLMPGTAQRFGVNPNDPLDNTYGALKYQKFLYDRYLTDTGDEKQAMLLTAAAYNSGEGNVEKYKGIPPFEETQNYVRYVASRIRGAQVPQATKEAVDWQNPESIQAEANQVFASPEEQTKRAATVQGQTITPYDLEWHLGIPAAQAAGWFEGLPKRKQAEVYQTVAHAVAQDQIKKAQGVELTPSAKYQSDMRRHLQVAQPVYSTATARRVMGVPPEPLPLALPQVGGDTSMGSIVTQARQQGDTRSSAQINDAQLMEQAVKNVSALSFSPTANIKGLYRAATKGIEGGFEADVQEEFQRLKETQARENTAEMIAARKRIGSIPGSTPRGVVSPRGVASAFQRFGGEMLKGIAGAADASSVIMGLGPIADYFGVNPIPAVRDYLNQRGNVLIESASMPLNAQGEAITRSLPEKATDAVTGLGLSVAQLILLKKATGLNLGPLMAIETTLKNSDRPISERVPDAAEAYVMGRVLDQHLTKPMSAIAFGAPTAVSTGLAYAQGNMSLEDALLQTGVQVGAGAVLGGKPKAGEPGAITLTKVPDFFPEEVAPGSAKTADWVYRQNEAFNNRIQAAEGRGDTAEADRLRAQLSGLQERFGKIMARTVPPEPGTGEASPELLQRVQAALENELRRTITRPTEPEIGEKQFAGLNNEQLQDLINARPKKGTTKAKRAEIADRKFAAEKELERRLAEPRTVPIEPTPIESQTEGLRSSESDIPSFKDYVENRPQGGIPFDTLFPGTSEYNMLVREYVDLYGQKGAQQDAGQISIQSQGGQAGEGNRQVGSEARNAATESEVGRVRNGQQAARQITELPNGQFQVVIETSQGKTKRTFNTREGAEAQFARLPRVPSEPSIHAHPAERLRTPLQTSTEVPREPSATVTPQTLQSQGAQPVSAETTPLAVKEGAQNPEMMTRDEFIKFRKAQSAPIKSESVITRSGTAELTINRAQELEIAKRDTLNQTPGKTITNELLQNSIDAGAKNIKIGVNQKAGTLTLQDNGSGMSADDVINKLLVLGNVGDKGEYDAGGFGRANAAFLLYPDTVSVRTTKDGLTTSFDTSSGELKTGKVKYDVERTGNPNGTSIQLKFPEGSDYELRQAADHAKEFAGKMQRDVNISLTRQDRYSGAATTEDLAAQPQEQKHPPIRVEHDGSTFLISFVKRPINKYAVPSRGKYGIPTEVLNKGLPLEGVRVSVGGLVENPDFAAVVNLEKSPLTSDPNYPFIKNRTVLRREAATAVEEAVKPFVDSLNQQTRNAGIKELKGDMESAPVYAGTKVVLSGLKGDAASEVKSVLSKNAPILSDIGRGFQKFQQMLTDAGHKDIEMVISTDPNNYGWRPNEALGINEIYAINPFIIDAKLLEHVYAKAAESGKDPNEMRASNMVHTLVHEFTHNSEKGHNETFTMALGRHYTELGHRNLGELESYFESVLKQKGSEYDAIQKQLNEVYAGLAKRGEGVSTSTVAFRSVSRRGGEERTPASDEDERLAEEHKRIIDRALSEGRPVYENWREEYPDLARKYGVPLKPIAAPSLPSSEAKPIEPAAVVKHSKPELDGAKVIGKTGGGAKLKVEKRDGTRTIIQNPRGPLGNREASVGRVVPVEPLKPIPILSGGGEATATTERGTTVNTRYAIVEAKDLVTSHDDFQNENGRFPAELQPRDRSRVASAAQISAIAKNPRPAELADSPKAAHGSPIIADDGVVEVGNGRSIALRQMYETGGEPASRYRQFVTENAERLGLDKSAVDKAEQPVLVRVRTTPLDDAQRVQFVNEGNEQGGARMSTPEQALVDAKGISGPLLSLFRPSESGEINTAANHSFIQAFMRDVVGPAEIGEYVDSRGAISQAGIARIRNAIFAHAYADTPQGLTALEKLAESPDNNVRNITNALLQRAGGFANLKEGIADGTRYDLDITSDLTKALSKMSSLREQGQTVGDYLKQVELFDPELTPLQRQMLHILDEYKRSGKAINEVLGNYLELTEAAGNPNQEGLFGTRETAPDPDDLFEIAARKVAEDANATKGKPAQASLLTSQGVPPEPQTGSGRTGASPSAIGGTREPGDQGSGGLFEANQPDTSAGGAGTGALGFGRGRVKPPPPLPTTAPELQDVTRQMTPGLGNKHGEIVDGLLSLALPSAKSPEHLRIAETLGARIGEMHHRAEAAASALGKWITKFYKAGVDRGDVEPKDNPGVQFASALSTGGAIDPKFEAAARLVKTLFDGRLRLLEEAGVPLNQVRENYFPGMWTRESRVAFNAAIEDGIKEGVITEGENLNVSTPEQRQWVRERTDAYMKQGTGSDRDMLSYIARRPLAGKESFKKEKVFDDILTAQELGLRPFSNNPMEIAKLKLAEIDKSIAAHQFFGDLKGKGQIGQITPYEQVPAGWTKINDKYGTIYGSPTIKLTEHIDKAVYQGLLDVATKLGISHERVASLRGGNLGLSYQGENRIQTRFATETSVMAHEIGHQLDAKYDLWNNLLRTQPKSGDPGKGFRAGRSELRDIADLTERGKVSRSKEEKIAQVLEAYTHSPERMEEVAPRVYKWFDNFVKATPELAPLAEIKPGIALQKLTTEKYVGLPILGYRIVPQPVGDILNNYLSSSLYNSQYFGKLFKGWMATASVLNQSQLGVGSAFHASFTSGDVQTAAGANMIKDIYGVVRGNRDAGDIANSFGKWTTAIVRTPIVGDRVLNAWRDPNGVINPRIAQVVRATELAQGGFKLERGLKTEQTDKMVSDWYSGHQIKAAFRSPIAATELMAKPILEWLVPREKAGAFADMAWRIIEQNPGKSMEDMTPDFRKAWNRIDGRLGEVRYDRIFINNAAKNVVQGLIRAPGWTGGTLAELGGAFKDVGSFVSEWARTGKAPQEMPDRVAYGLSLLISTAVVNGMLTYAFTGEKPHGLDFWAFRDGGQDKDGNKTRLLIPTYMKDILAYYEEGPKALVAKGHPLISLVNDVVIKNQDYFGQEIRNPDDPYYQQAGEVGRYVLKAFIPFWIRGVQRQEEQGAGLGRQAASYFGVMPAPGYLIQDEPTKALNQMIKAKLPAVRTPPTDRQQAMREIIQGRRSGEDTAADLLAARQEGLVNKRDVQRIGEQGRISPMQAKLESVYRDYGLTGILDWYEKYGDYMDSEDKADTQKVIRKARLSLAQHPENLRGTASERAALIQRLNNALGLKSVPTAPPSGSTNITVPAPP